MDHFVYQRGELYCEQVPVRRIAEEVGTPVYVYSQRTFLDHYARVREAFAELNPIICFSVKCCQNIHICRL
ncbi:MAG: diaminopimelate decarboxylase, partial [Phycisphaerae bacterium]